jgi:hypothetical protein
MAKKNGGGVGFLVPMAKNIDGRGMFFGHGRQVVKGGRRILTVESQKTWGETMILGAESKNYRHCNTFFGHREPKLSSLQYVFWPRPPVSARLDDKSGLGR